MANDTPVGSNNITADNEDYPGTTKVQDVQDITEANSISANNKHARQATSDPRSQMSKEESKVETPIIAPMQTHNIVAEAGENQAENAKAKNSQNKPKMKSEEN